MLESNNEIRKRVKELETNSEVNFNEYTKCKNDLEHLYVKIAEVVKARSKCQ